jgi:hypothetical protein
MTYENSRRLFRLDHLDGRKQLYCVNNKNPKSKLEDSIIPISSAIDLIKDNRILVFGEYHATPEVV